ncbi:MAG: ABC transporter substrate-binding protein [Acidimicrobiia bacterium]|nr:ABC transporter substrate-binding protein [Acidimicrobiia bacterium]MCL4291548.1 ABC transporter substrate-binding protein [Acidimicrobiia bacterium]
MRTRRVILALTVVAAMLLAACGSDSDDKAAPKDTENKDEPIKIVLFWEVQGESQVAVDDYNNGAMLAVDEINKAGGIDGHQIEVKRIPAPVFDTQKLNAAYLKALDEKPSAIIGFPAPPQVPAVIANITRGRVPALVMTAGGDNVRFGAEAGSEFSWWMDYGGSTADVAIDYMTDELKIDKIALMGDSGDYGTEFVNFAKKALEGKDLKPTTEQSFAPDAADLTQQVLAVKSSGAQGVFNAAYPNPLAVQLKQFQQNGLAVPTFSFGSSPFVVNYKMATGEALKNFFGVEACNFLATDQASSKAFSAEYQKRYPKAGPPSYMAGYSHDALYLVKAAVEKAGSTDPEKINEALDGLEVTDGVVCGARYQADGSHFLRRDGVVVSYGPTSPPGKIVKTFEIPLLDKA